MIMTYGTQAKRVYIDWANRGDWFDSDAGSIELDESGNGWWLFLKGASTAEKFRKPKQAKAAALKIIRTHFKNGL